MEGELQHHAKTLYRQSGKRLASKQRLFRPSSKQDKRPRVSMRKQDKQSAVACLACLLPTLERIGGRVCVRGGCFWGLQSDELHRVECREDLI